MTSAAWILMSLTWTIVIGFTAYFFFKVLFLPPRQEEIDSQPVPGDVTTRDQTNHHQEN